MEKILTVEQMRTALYLDYDYDEEELIRLSILASSYLKTKTGYDWTLDTELEPLAIQAAILYVRMMFFDNTNYKKENDFTIGLGALIVDLQGILEDRV